MRIGYIGLGIMGQPMAGNLLAAGHDLTVYNRTATKCRPLAERGAVVAESPAQVAAGVEVVFINVTDTPDVEAVLFGPQGVSGGAAPGLVVIDNSTIAPAATREFAARLRRQGIDYLDAPVSGGDVGAQQGTLAIMVGGETELFRRCRPLLEVLGSKIVHVGPVGMGQTCKACNQLFCALHMLACAEGVTLARRAGLDPAVMVEVVSQGAGGSWALSNLGPKILADDMAPGFMIELLNKDLRIAAELADQTRTPLSGATLAQQFFKAAESLGHGRDGTQALIKALERLGDGTR